MYEGDPDANAEGDEMSIRSGNEKAVVRPGARAASSDTAHERCLWSWNKREPSQRREAAPLQGSVP